jgi:hypothetical protein
MSKLKMLTGMTFLTSAGLVRFFPQTLCLSDVLGGYIFLAGWNAAIVAVFPGFLIMGKAFT